MLKHTDIMMIMHLSETAVREREVQHCFSMLRVRGRENRNCSEVSMIGEREKCRTVSIIGEGGRGRKYSACSES